MELIQKIDKVIEQCEISSGLWVAGVGRVNQMDIIGVFSSPCKATAICGEQQAKDEPESIANSLLYAASKALLRAGIFALAGEQILHLNARNAMQDAIESALDRTWDEIKEMIVKVEL